MEERTLEELLKLAANDRAHAPEFYKKLLSSEVYLLGLIEKASNLINSKEEAISLEPGDEVNFTFWHYEDGTQFLPIFSSLNMLQSVIKEDSQYIKFPAKVLFEMVKGIPIFLNPKAQYGREFLPKEIESLLKNQTTQEAKPILIEKETQVLIGHPANYPQNLIDTLNKFLPKITQVREAYLALYLNPTIDDKPVLLIAIDIEGGIQEYEKIRNGIGTVAQESAPKGEIIDFLLLDKSDVNNSINMYFRDKKPFYKRT
ncbi:MAG: enhanced serine sensitivity protein SseB C-terminal domain-containing protein [Candidatus Lokiarchaeota archaeon]|nr:enhanced serine sensitivity protein SseB C-terminal domain-containing protein [Candidatus Lokiarchaeota archaeon]